MKALSIKQPWASLIANGIKDIENRTWKTKFRGKIFIHSSSKGAPDFTFTQQQHEALSTVDTDNIDMPYSAIIGEVDIVDCVINHDSIWAEKTPTIYKKPSIKDEGLRGYYEALKMFKENKPIYNWVLANPVLYKKPILNVKGKLSFWEFEKPTLKTELKECMVGRDAECNHPNCPVTDEDVKNGKYCTLPLYDYRE